MVAGYLDGTDQAAETFTRGVDGLLRYINADPAAASQRKVGR
jgi:hypothetical protein